MPPLVLHMAFARQLQDVVHSQLVEAHAGAFILGATTPDIRVLTRWEREQTHFFDFDVYEHQDSVARFLAERPELADAGRVAPETAAFVAGYATHLVLDQRWIDEIYRVFFGERSPLGGGAQAKVLDRLLAYELDRRKREDRSLMKALEEALVDAEVGVDCGFIDRETLARWRALAAEQTTYPADYERVRHYASRYLYAWNVDVDVPEEFGKFLRRVPQLVEAAAQHVTPERVNTFLECTHAEARSVIERYLACG